MLLCISTGSLKSCFSIGIQQITTSTWQALGSYKLQDWGLFEELKIKISDRIKSVLFLVNQQDSQQLLMRQPLRYLLFKFCWPGFESGGKLKHYKREKETSDPGLEGQMITNKSLGIRHTHGPESLHLLFSKVAPHLMWGWGSEVSPLGKTHKESKSSLKFSYIS